MKPHYGAELGLALGISHLLLVESLTQECEDGPVASGRGFDHVGNKLFLGGLVEVFDGLA